MFETLTPAQPDAIIRLMQSFRDDPRPDKIDLGVGVYRDASGATPVMRAVKAAEAAILRDQDTKSYVALTGDSAFHDAVAGLLLGSVAPRARLAMAATPGGTSAVRQALELIRSARPDATIWLSDPTWPNHPGLVAAAGLRARRYRWHDTATGALDRDGLYADMAQVGAGDVVLVHGCCHNPTGVDLQARDWAELGALLDRRGAVPLIDMAYLGFGEGVDADATGLRHLVARLPEVLVAFSGSKSFGLYRERVGLVMAIVPERVQPTVAGHLSWLNRQNFAFPPDHGARVVSRILSDPALAADWRSELETMRLRLQQNRHALAMALRDATGSDRFGALATQSGMFSILNVGPQVVERLRHAHAIYLIEDGRMNIAGLTGATIATFARALSDTLRTEPA